jgi:hypothetical protein
VFPVAPLNIEMSVRASMSLHRCVLATGFSAAMLTGSAYAASSRECKPTHFRAPSFIKSMSGMDRCSGEYALREFEGGLWWPVISGSSRSCWPRSSTAPSQRKERSGTLFFKGLREDL